MTGSAASKFQNMDRSASGSMKWMKYPPEILPMWVADMDFQAPAAVLEALHARVDHGVFGYTLPTAELKQTCCEYFLRKWNWRIEPDWLVMSPGLGVGIHTVSRYIGELDKGLLTPEPIYHVFRKAAVRAKRPRIDVPMAAAGEGWVWSPEAIEEAAAKAGGAGVLMLCNPHNPNGKVFTRAELERLGELALSHGWTICSDDVHADLVLDGDAYVPIASLDPAIADICITMQSPSKAYNIAGLNFAVMVISNPELRQAYEAGASGQVVSQLNPMGMAAGQAAWSGACDQWLEECLDLLRSHRDLLQREIDAIDGIAMRRLPSTYLAWLDVSGLGLADPPAHFERHGLGMSPGADFGDPDYMRLNFGCDRSTLERGIERLKRAAELAGK